ncbi:Uncharacterised protein [Klebsiella pneumoniae]|uniref:Uncharacterized protein n=1 Tax=Klebsiella pneumoniae TaxID=573 RepID=A0A377V6Y9_KLEPN|nr:Uncharacterised protein [Klebsiella pneumoniae]
MTPEEQGKRSPRPGSSLRRRDNRSYERKNLNRSGTLYAPPPILRKHYEKVKPMGVSLVKFVSVIGRMNGAVWSGIMSKNLHIELGDKYVVTGSTHDLILNEKRIIKGW